MEVENDTNTPVNYELSSDGGGEIPFAPPVELPEGVTGLVWGRGILPGLSMASLPVPADAAPFVVRFSDAEHGTIDSGEIHDPDARVILRPDWTVEVQNTPLAVSA